MKKNLLLTTALASSLVVAGSGAIAQTTITGDMALTYAALSYKDNSGNGFSRRGAMRETQLNVTNTGKLNNGMGYAMGFALEFDGTGYAVGRQTAVIDNSISNENVYFDLLFGPTTVTVGVDHAPRGYASVVPQVYNIVDLAPIANSATSFVVGGGVVESFGAGVNHKFMGLTASAYYTPKLRDTGQTETTSLGAGAENSAYELGLAGTIQGTGLSVKAFTSNSKKRDSQMGGDIESTVFGLGYNFGKFAIGAEYIEDRNNHQFSNQEGISNQATTSGYNTGTRVEKTKWAGVSYNIDKNSSVSVGQFKTELGGSVKAATQGDEKVSAVQYGYNFGPVGLSLSYLKFENMNYATALTASGDMGIARLTAKF